MGGCEVEERDKLAVDRVSGSTWSSDSIKRRRSTRTELFLER